MSTAHRRELGMAMAERQKGDLITLVVLHTLLISVTQTRNLAPPQSPLGARNIGTKGKKASP